MLLLRELVSALLIGSVVGDLICKDYVPHNWTTPRARLSAYITGPPVNLTSSIPQKVGTKKTIGDIYHLKTCNSSSLYLKSSFGIGCDDPERLSRRAQGTGCYGEYLDYIQVIHPSTGHCLTVEYWQDADANLTWTTCNLNPQNTIQLFYALRMTRYHENRKNQPGSIYDWDPTVGLAPIPNYSWRYSRGDFHLNPKDNRTITASPNWSYYSDVGIVALHYDPLTTYPKGKL